MPPWYEPVRRAFAALFPEARRLQRRRRLRYALLLLLAGAVVVAILRTGGAGPGAAGPVARLARASVVSVPLPAAGHFSSIAVTGGRLILSGGPQGSLPVSGYETSLLDGRAAGTCDAAKVNPRTLAVGRVASANCGDPALYGEHVLPIVYFLHPPASAPVGGIGVRIARADPAARDGYTLGPIVTTFPECSDCQVAWIYGDRSLWLYNPLAGQSRNRGLLLRISTHTGDVLERWSMPEILQSLLAVDADGLWLSPSIESGLPGEVPASKRARYLSLYRIKPGERTPQRMLTERGQGARWLVASGDTASAAIANDHGGSVVWTFTGRRPRVHGPTLNDSHAGTELGSGGPTVAGNDTIGFYNVILGNGTERVIQIKRSSRQERTIATIPARNVTIDDQLPTGAALDGSFFFLDPPTNRSPSSSQLHRVTPR